MKRNDTLQTNLADPTVCCSDPPKYGPSQTTEGYCNKKENSLVDITEPSYHSLHHGE